MTLAAVLTGDLIGSTGVEVARVEHTMAVLANASELVAHAAPTRFTRYRGDGWQIYLADPRDFIWVAMYLRAALTADPHCLATRIAIGIGTVDSLGETGLAGASGAAFTASGRALDSMTTGQELALAGTTVDDIQRSLLAFVADRMAGWSREQAEVVQLMWDHGGHQDIANKLGISRQAVGARLHAAGYRLIETAGRAFYAHYDQQEP